MNERIMPFAMLGSDRARIMPIPIGNSAVTCPVTPVITSPIMLVRLRLLNISVTALVVGVISILLSCFFIFKVLAFTFL